MYSDSITSQRRFDAALLFALVLLLAQFFAVTHHHSLADSGQSDICLQCVFQGESDSVLISVSASVPAPFYSLVLLLAQGIVLSIHSITLSPSARDPPARFF